MTQPEKEPRFPDSWPSFYYDMVPHDMYEMRAKLYLVKCINNVVGLLIMFCEGSKVILDFFFFLVLH